jgi:predicted AAA+ superfamily ATPase
MVYLSRFAEKTLLRLSKQFKVILILGARQVGKTRLLQHLFSDAKYFVFDASQDLYNTRQDPDLFLQTYPAPLILDEIQYAPEILSSLKRHVDIREEKGLYFLTGSQNFAALSQISESMAGRVMILELMPMTPFEKHQIPLEQTWVNKYLDDPSNFYKKPYETINERLVDAIWKGGYPGVLDLEEEDFHHYFRSYVQTYTERDIRVLSNIKDTQVFSNFLAASAALTAQEVNHSQLANSVGISAKTAFDWMRLQSYSYQHFSIKPYSGNLLKRVSKSPKSYITDSGLASYLLRISSPDSLLGSMSLGPLFETFCVSMIRTISSLQNVELHHWRSSSGAEVDLIIEKNGMFFPIEFKAKTNPSGMDARGITQFKKAYPHLNVQKGLVVHGGKEILPLSPDVVGIPWGCFFTKTSH